MQLQYFFEQSVKKFPSNIALVCDNTFVSYQELENRANQLAHYLNQQNINKGCIVGILLERSIDAYIAILAVLKLGAVYVPIEIDYPDERINYIFSDLSFNAILTSSVELKQRKVDWPKAYALDDLNEQISRQSTSSLHAVIDYSDADKPCYIIYTSGSTGKPKGVIVTHNNICHYVREASALYNMNEHDRVYQGFSLAFDASLEELWMAFANGAALIACTAKEVRSGLGLVSFLKHHQVSFFSTVPTLLATLEGQLPDLRILILGGETCSSALVKRWSRSGLRIINTYGPTEATVIATYSECEADKTVTIGKALPGYEVFIMDERLQTVEDGIEGELCISGPAVAKGYVNRPESTAEKFVLNPENNQYFYRTGDLAFKDKEGNFNFVGRIDNQVKLRGFRIELDEIETTIMNYSGISQAIVSLQTLEQPILVAYLLLDKKSTIALESFKAYLRAMLPDYMVPSLIECVSEFPLLASGKVNRNELPKPTVIKNHNEYKAPATDLEKEIAQVWEQCFDYTNISVDADFFYDLGGHSLHAARIISSLRKIPSLKNISILDLYNHHTISQLAQKFHAADVNKPVIEEKIHEKYRAPQWKYLLCGVGQFFGVLLQYGLSAWQLMIIIGCYAWINASYGIISREAQIAFLSLFVCMPLISLAITVALKWLLLGRVKPGVYPLWGWFYYRWWLVQRLQQNVYLAKYLVGSPLISIYYRLLGAKIGSNCYIGTIKVATHDLLTIGDNTSIGAECKIQGYIVEDGWLKIGTTTIGNNCYIGSRSVIGLNTQLEDKAMLEALSMLPEFGLIPSGLYYAGSPATPHALPEEHIIKKKVKVEKSSILEDSLFGILHYLGLIFVMAMYFLCLIPGLSFISHFYDHNHYILTMVFAIPVGAVLFLALHYLCIILCKKLIMDKTKPGQYSLKSFYYLRHWIMDKMLNEGEISIMADTLYFPMFLRALGAKLGRGVEMGEAPHIIPDLVTIEEGGFAASSVAMAWPTVYNGAINFAPVHIGKKAFLGNTSLLPAGKRLGDGSLLGCASTTPVDDNAAKPDSSWLGSPAVFLPKRELFTGYSDQETYNPPKKLYNIRLAIEFGRIILPTAFTYIILFNMLYLLDFMLTHYTWQVAALILPAGEMLIILGLVGIIVLMKWGMLGKLKPLTKPIWDIFIWKNDVIEYSYNYFINTQYTNKVLGTPFALWLHRCLGTKAGKRIFTDSAEFSEFDLINIADDVCINSEAIIQTHLYEDRIFKVSQVTINSGCNIGVASIVLYNTLMEENSSLGSLSLLMKGECLPENTAWSGIPAQSIVITNSHAITQVDTRVEGAVEVIPELS